MHKNIKDTIFKIIDEEKDKANSGGVGALIAGLAPFLAIANLHVSIVAVIAGVLWEIKDNSEAKNKPMPDEFLEKLSKEKVSKKGLEFIAEKIEKKGFISIYEAIEWMEIENKEIEKTKGPESKEKISPGAEAILNKAIDEGVLVKNETLEAAKESIADGISVGIDTGKKVGKRVFKEVLDVAKRVKT